MRTAFVETLMELAKQDKRILLLTGDLGYTVLEPFAEKFPQRFFNVGVAEQNMLGVATGLAEAGFIPFVYSIATFVALRPYEFIRNGPILQRLPVRIVAIGGGFEYGHSGMTHHALEDIGIMRLQPAITVVAPADHKQARTALFKTWNLAGPVYYRFGKDDKTEISGLDGKFDLGRAQTIYQGRDALIIAMGSISSETLLAVKALEAQGIHCTMMVVASLNPVPIDDLVKTLSRFNLAFTIESHYIDGGLGSIVSELIAGHNIACRLIRCGVKTTPDGISGSQSFLHHRYGLSSSALVETISKALHVKHHFRSGKNIIRSNMSIKKNEYYRQKGERIN